MSDDRITANLPSADLNRTESFYMQLGFSTDFRDSGWMIMKRGKLEVEFFSFPDHNPRTGSFSACIRVDDLDGLYAAFGTLGLTDNCYSIPRLTAPVKLPNVPRMFALIDCDGSLLRCLENEDA